MDASPWGLGGILRVNGVFTSYFASALDEHDLSRFGFALGDAKGQQTWECLVVLVALRLWLPRFRDKRVCLRVRSDNVAALQLLLTLRSAGKGPTAIGRELALDCAQGSFRPNVAVHLPGVANVGPDALSRLSCPGGGKSVPEYLFNVPRSYPPIRTAQFYRADVPTL